MRIKAGSAALAGAALVALVGCGAERTDSPRERGPASSSVTSSAEGRFSSEELQRRWWTWAASEPERTNPVADQDGSSCGRNQPRDVWFLAGSFGGQVERTCSVPAGVPLVFPLVNRIGEPSECADFMGAAEGTAVLDGRRIAPEEHQGTTIFVRSVADNPVTGSEAAFMATGCGLWVQLEPLESGQHTLTIRGESGAFSAGVDYALRVEDASK